MSTYNADSLVYFSMAMKKLREERQLSQAQLAELSRLSVVTINQVEGAKRGVGLSTLDKIALSLDNDVPYMMKLGAILHLENDSMATRNILSRNVRKFREEKGLTQEGLANLAGLSTSTVASIENTRKAATIDVVHSIAVVLKVPVHVLFFTD